MFDYSNLNLIQSMTIGCWKYYKLTGTLLKDYQVLQKLFLKYKDVTLPDVTELSVEILKKLLKKSPSYKNLSSAEQKSVKDLAHALTIACSQRIKAVHKKLNIVYKNGNLQWKCNSDNQALKVINERFQNQTNKIEKSLALIAIPELRQTADVMMYSSYPFIRTYCNRVNASSSNYGSPFDERFQNVVIGYLAATMSWDYKNGAKFSTFALFYGRSIASRNDVENNMNFHFNVGFVQRCKNLHKHSISLRNEVSIENTNQQYHQIEKKVRTLLGPTLFEVESFTFALGHQFDYESSDSLIESVESFEELSEDNLYSLSYILTFRNQTPTSF